jgi:hypothetical protein
MIAAIIGLPYVRSCAENYWHVVALFPSQPQVGVVIIEAPTLYHARTRVAVRGIGRAADYGDGKELDEDVALVSPNCIGGLLWAKEAQQLSDRLCAAKVNGPR